MNYLCVPRWCDAAACYMQTYGAVIKLIAKVMFVGFSSSQLVNHKSFPKKAHFKKSCTLKRKLKN